MSADDSTTFVCTMTPSAKQIPATFIVLCSDGKWRAVTIEVPERYSFDIRVQKPETVLK